MKSGEKSGIRAELEPVSEHAEKLRGFVQTLARESREKDRVPLRDDGRIDMDAFASIYPDISADKEKMREWFVKWYGNIPEDAALRKRLETDGEKLEMLYYAILQKNLGGEFIVVRSSFHDDRVNKVDTLLLEKNTGNLICAFDEVGATSGVDFEKKQKAIQDHNLHHQGANVKYALGIKDGQLILGEVQNVPLFYIALPKDRIQKGVAEFIPSLDQQSDFEKKLFQYFIAAIQLQIQGLELYSGRLNPELKKRLQTFENVAKKMKK